MGFLLRCITMDHQFYSNSFPVFLDLLKDQCAGLNQLSVHSPLCWLFVMATLQFLFMSIDNAINQFTFSSLHYSKVQDLPLPLCVGRLSLVRGQSLKETFYLGTLTDLSFSPSLPPDDFSFNQRFKVSCFIKKLSLSLLSSCSCPKRRTASDKTLSLLFVL